MIQVSLQDIPKHWAWVERGLNEIIRRTREKWSPAHVSQALYEGRAQLYVSDDGFFVLHPMREEWTLAPITHVWAMWFERGIAKQREQELRNWLDAETGGRIRMSSPRMGWGRALGDGWEIERVIWRRKA